MNIVFTQNLPAQEKHRISLVHTTPLALDSEGYLNTFHSGKSLNRIKVK